MAQVYEVIGSISQTSGVTGYPCRLVVGESAGGIVYQSVYPPAQSDTYVKATTKYNTNHWPHYTTDPTKALTGSDTGNCWLASDGSVTNQRFHIDLGSEKVITRIYYENGHVGGTETDHGSKDFTFWGTNSATAFAELTYGTDTDWTQIGGALQFDQHTASNVADPKYITVNNNTAYRYYAFKIANNWGDTRYHEIRRIELQENIVDVHCNAHCKTDMQDIRFFDGSDNALDYWIDWTTLTGTTPNQSVEVWVKTAAATDGTTVKLKYGDAALDDASDGVAVFTIYKDFESGSDGDSIATADADWTVVSGTCEIDTTQKYSGERSLRLVGGTTQDTNIALTAGEGYIIQYWVRKSNGADYFQVLHGNGTRLIQIVCLSTEDIKYYNAAGALIDTGYNCAVDTWMLFEIRNIDWTAGTFDLHYNGGCIKAAAEMGTSGATTDALRFYSAGTSGNDAWIDDLIVRKYASPEPVWGTWGEETEIDYATELTVAASSHAASSDNVSLIQGPELTVADSASVLTSDGMSLTQVHVLALGDSSHITDSDIVSLVADFRLAITDSSHLADSDNVGLVPDFRLVVAEPVNVVGSENLELSTSTPLVIASSTSLLSSDNIDLIQLCILVVEGSSSASTSEEPSLSHSGLLLLTIGDSLHSMGADNVEVFQSHVLTVSDSTSLFTPSGELIFLEFWVSPGGVLIGPFGNLELLLLEGNLELLFFSGDLELLSFTGGHLE